MSNRFFKFLIMILPLVLVAILLNLAINHVKSEPTTSTLTEPPTAYISPTEQSTRWATDSALLSLEAELKIIKSDLGKPPTDNFPLDPPKFSFDLGFGL